MTFEEDFLRKMAQAFGLTAEDMSAASIGRLQYMRQAKAYSDALYDRWVMEAMLHAYIEMPIRVEAIVGYDPQKLLPYKPISALEWYDQYSRYGPIPLGTDWISRHFETMYSPVFEPSLCTNQHIDFGTTSPTARRLAPFVSPISELRSRGLTPIRRRIADFVDPRWPKAFDDEDDARLNVLKRAAQGKTEEPIATIGGGTHVYQSEINKRLADAGIEVIVVSAHADYAHIKRRIMAANINPKIKSLYIDIDHVDESHMLKPFDLPIKAEKAKKQPDYLKHDPSKQHRRRRRK